jgi:mRNA-degrading endonuclease HigB of HigAB toxin-antitoxin module
LSYIYTGAIKLNLEWLYNCDNVNWDELSNLYKIAPLGEKKPNDLKTVFSNSMFKCFVYSDKHLLVLVELWQMELIVHIFVMLQYTLMLKVKG